MADVIEIPQRITSEVILGIAKKFNAELDKLPIHSHGTVLHAMNGLLQHRQINDKIEGDMKMQAAYAEAERKQKEAELRDRFGIQPANA